jgi:HAD superfamily hydrolase (TIGR01490 family)
LKSLALFDLDHTLLSGDSDHAWGHFLLEQGVVQGDEHRQRNEAFWQQYKDGTLDINAYLRFALAPISGKSDADLAALRATFMLDKIEPMISAAALRLLEKHAGELCAIVTATNAFVTKPIAQRFGVDHLIACEVEMVAGRYTGNPIGIPSFRDGKVSRVDAWLSSMGMRIEDFETSWFYSDSFNDLPLLKRVNRPVAVNPDATLRQFATEQGWPVLDLMSGEL